MWPGYHPAWPDESCCRLEVHGCAPRREKTAMLPEQDPRPASGTPSVSAGDLPAPEMVTLRDDSQVIIRPIRPDDAPRLQSLFSRLSPESIFLRFLSRARVLSDQQARRLATLDYDRRMAWAATPAQDPQEQIIGVARYAVLAGEDAVAEAAVVVEDRWQRLGLGTILLRRLADYARARGIHTFQATVHQTNSRILGFIGRSGLPSQRKVDGGLWEIRVRLNEE